MRVVAASQVLAAFSESDENVAQVAAMIGEGFPLTPYTDARSVRTFNAQPALPAVAVSLLFFPAE